MPIEPIQCGSNTQSPLTCATDSVTICPGSEPIPVIICQDDPLAVCFTLDCITDSITICPGDIPITVDGVVSVSGAVLVTQGTTPWTITPDAHLVSSLSSIIPLGSGLSFTSPWISVDKYADIRVSCHTDQNGDLLTQHSNDNGVTIIRDSIQPIIANRAEFLSFHPRANYFRVVMTNTSAGAQTFLDLSTDVDTVSYGVTQSQFSAPLGSNSLGVQTRSVLYDYNYDETAIITPSNGELVTVSRVSLLSDPFNIGFLDPILWNSTLVGTGTSAVVTNKLQMLTGITANSTAKVNSTIRGRFVSGNLQSVRSMVITPDAGTLNNKRRWGAYDDDNGYFYELDGLVLYAVGRLSGVDTRVACNAWSKINTFVYKGNVVNPFEISFYDDTAIFIVDGEVHHNMFGGGLRGSFPNTFENINYGGSTTGVELGIIETVQQRYGPSTEQPRFYNVAGAGTVTLKQGAGHLDKILIGSGGSGTVTIYDSLSATGTIILNMSSVTASTSLPIGIEFSNGLTVVTTGAATDVTAVFS